jgi:hypothetical protein
LASRRRCWVFSVQKIHSLLLIGDRLSSTG